jgi:flagellar motor switch protein FliN/FliY
MSGDKDTEFLEENPTAETVDDVPTVEPEAAPRDDSTESILGDLAESVSDPQNLDMLLDVNLKITVELGRARLKFREVLDLATGSVVELSRLTSEPVDILVNGALLATGEVVVVDDHFAVRINKLLNRVERLKRVI